MADSTTTETFTYLTCFFQGVNFMFLISGAYLLLKYSSKDRLKKILAGIFLYNIFIYLKYIPIYYSSLVQIDYLRHLSHSFDIWLIPAFALYLLEVIKPGWVNLKRILLVLLPFLILTLLYTVFENLQIYNLITIYAITFSLAVYIYFLSYYKRHKAKIEAYYSNLQPFNTRWIHLLVVNILVVYLAVWIFVKEDYIKNLTSVFYYIFTLGIYIFILYNGMKQESIYREQDLSTQNEKISSTANYERQIKRLLESEMQRQKLFLNPHLTVNDVAHSLGTNRTYLSNYLNNTLNITFFDYINKCRIEYSKNLLTSPDNHDTLDVIAEKSGFNSLSTFRRAFVKECNSTPSEYRRNKLLNRE